MRRRTLNLLIDVAVLWLSCVIGTSIPGLHLTASLGLPGPAGARAFNFAGYLMMLAVFVLLLLVAVVFGKRESIKFHGAALLIAAILALPFCFERIYGLAVQLKK